MSPSDPWSLSLPTTQAAACFLVGAVILAFAVFGLKRRFFSEGYSLLWIILGISFLLIPFFIKPLRVAAAFLYFQSVSVLFFILGILALFAFVIIMSIHISKLRRQVVQLSQNVAINRALASFESAAENKNKS